MDFISFQYEVVTVDDQGVIGDRTVQQSVYLEESLSNGISLKMVQIPGGQFQMGTSAESEGLKHQVDSSETPVHWVTLSSFWMGMTPVTRSQYQAVMGRLPEDLPLVEPTAEDQAKLAELEAALNQQLQAWLQTEGSEAQWPEIQAQMQTEVQEAERTAQQQEEAQQHYPVEGISWQEATEFCERLSAMTGRSYRLPSEAEWEYACRAGTQSLFHVGNILTPELAHYRSNTEQDQEGAIAVGQFPPNAFGLYDMHGNVWEWCADYWHGTYTNAPIDGSAWQDNSETSERVLRGGAWNSSAMDCRSASRWYRHPSNKGGTFGFRVCLSLQTEY